MPSDRSYVSPKRRDFRTLRTRSRVALEDEENLKCVGRNLQVELLISIVADTALVLSLFQQKFFRF